MPVISAVLQTDTNDQWRVKTNSAIAAINSEAINTIVNLTNLQDGDILVYNTTSQFFENVGVAGFVSNIIAELATIPTTNLKPYYYASLRTIF